MKKAKVRWPSPAVTIAGAALFFVLGGGALAAQHYVISSVNQIKPSVVKQLRGDRGPRGLRGAKGKQGPAGPLVTPEAWHDVGSSGAPAFSNGWANSSDTSDTTAAYYKDPFGVIHLKGTVDDGSATSDNVFTLPSGDRPAATAHFLAVTMRVSYLDDFASVRIDSAGVVAITRAGGGATDYALDGITFRP